MVKVWQQLPYWSCHSFMSAPGHVTFQVSTAWVLPDSGVMRRYCVLESSGSL